MMLLLLIFGLEKKTFPAGRPLDKNRNGIHDATKNTCKPRLEKKEQKRLLLTKLSRSETKSGVAEKCR